ncbi:glycoside hydrolase family 2 TIM barrel-domain containing protein [Christiangramia salexigens]|uniref:Glycoside hydrolase family 2 catalytic domain-containing protein n=1 Tax=Christiangramia salexigens TaxID=1913577 RepID=A0A1L3J7U2_9FLAO|nr:glycoside hydrolase family 2 TIM barrel-domain containing protein [Christiangramia salexigens]APG61197.1 hypothetical protein LPB144_12630 [Christiangramia salexigens]
MFTSCSKHETRSFKSASVYIQDSGSGFKLIRNGKPFVIKGAGGNEHLEELKLAGANTIRVYNPDELPLILQNAERLDLAVIADIPLPQAHDIEFYSDQKKFDSLKTEVLQIVNRFKDHPALLYWNLGNELMYPTLSFTTDFSAGFNELINEIHQLDKNHPVSTSIIGGNRRRLVSIAISSANLDFLSFNSFGNLHELQEKIESVSFIWDGPYVISEWGINGPWEEERTSWYAPIEQTSTKKAEHFKTRYNQYISKLDSKRCLGSLAFYWGNKQETTSTWYSIFSPDGDRTESYYELSQIWKGNDSNYKGPRINYALLNGQGAKNDIILNSGSEAILELEFLNSKSPDNTLIEWEVKREAWFKAYNNQPNISSGVFNGTNSTSFVTPSIEGPYRVFIKASKNGDFATTNIPFYVLNSSDGK